jgi:DNA mismatch repair protein MutS
LTGVPAGVIQQARLRLRLLERQMLRRTAPARTAAQLPLFDAEPHPALAALAALADPATLDPEQARAALCRLRALLP